MSGEDKIGGLLVCPLEYEDFAFCINSYELLDLGFKDSPFTWWTGGQIRSASSRYWIDYLESTLSEFVHTIGGRESHKSMF